MGKIKPRDLKETCDGESKYHKAKIVCFSLLMFAILAFSSQVSASSHALSFCTFIACIFFTIASILEFLEGDLSFEAEGRY